MNTPAQALLNQLDYFRRTQAEWRRMIQIMDRPTDLSRRQWIQLAAFALDFRPDLIIELGRGYGNSTAMFLEVCAQTGSKLISLCRSDAFEPAKLGKPASWLAPADIRVCEITEQEIDLIDYQRVFLFWDAHGFEVAEWVLGRLMPRLSIRQHLVAMHDLSDLRFNGVKSPYQGPMWKGEIGEHAFHLGNIYSKVPQAISAVDFTTRNGVGLNSAETSLTRMTPAEVSQCETLGDLFGFAADWFYFSLNQGQPPYTFPLVPESSAKAAALLAVERRCA